jgi:hypothetical protein
MFAFSPGMWYNINVAEMEYDGEESIIKRDILIMISPLRMPWAT